MDNEKKNRTAEYKYKAKKWKRIPLDIDKNYYNNILLPTCNKLNMPVNTFIKQAIAEKIDRENIS